MEYFEQFGDINSSFYQVEKRYAFVEFDDPAVARAVLLERSHFIKVMIRLIGYNYVYVAYIVPKFRFILLIGVWTESKSEER